ncbi:hypothetical protein J2S15_002853 [Breznakia pachnodae]|uniref:Uncharacterized protein n=1 Tax=Breznakia pachnodae TaxID=265178 RepID=A0ABU0E5K7_9FIRM|nr:hypothetical protein [Breznakia pachnodae]
MYSVDDSMSYQLMKLVHVLNSSLQKELKKNRNYYS